MENSFYQDFDTATLAAEPRRADEYRSVFQIQRDRIIHSAAFRRLQGKTQVFIAGEYDFYRTRLTHSIEVSQIGRSLCASLRRNCPLLGPDHFIDPDLVEAACLAHDLGHPPFGHAGERSLHRLMKAHGGFEGNAQTLRLLTETIFSHGHRGLNPCRALLDGVLKYKSLLQNLPDADCHFIYDEQAAYLDFVNNGTPFPGDAPPGSARSVLRSVECQIMDWADDTAYSLNDIVDGVNAGFITTDRLERWADAAGLDPTAAAHVADLCRVIRDDRLEPRTNRKIGDFIAACTLGRRHNFLSARTNRHAFQLIVDASVFAESKVYKRIALDLVFRTPQMQQLDFKADQVLTRLFETFASVHLASVPGPMRLLPAAVEHAVRTATDIRQRARLLCDFLSCQTDSAASRLSARLFDPNFGSIIDLV